MDKSCKTYNLMLKMQNLMFANMHSFMISPFGVEVLTLGLMSGSGGKTFDELAKLLIGTEIKPEELNETIRFYKTAISKLQTLDNCDVVFQNYIYVSQKYEMTKKFQDYVSICLDIKARSTDFGGDITELFNQIDQDIKELSKKKYDYPVSHIPTVARILAVNCTYFQAVPKYMPQVKYISNFIAEDGDPIPMEFTIQTGIFKSYVHDEFEWLEMPYKNDQMSLCLLLPKPGRNVRAILERLTCSNLCDIMNATSDISAELHLPPVRLVWNFDMAIQMQLAGIQKIFEREAEMSRMAKNHKSLHCDSVMMNLDFSFMNLTKATIPVMTEEMVKTREVEVRSIVVGSPFIYYLTYGKTPYRVVVFAGVVNRIEL